MNRLRGNKKGFTLVELIVMLVILAILIALLVPTLTGYIDRANQRSAHADIKLIANAANSAYAEIYSDNTSRNGEVIVVFFVDTLCKCKWQGESSPVLFGWWKSKSI